jgi:hypothetical protein
MLIAVAIAEWPVRSVNSTITRYLTGWLYVSELHMPSLDCDHAWRDA